MPLRHSNEGEIMDDRERYARFATHLNSKKAGPLVCPICNATESFEAKGTLAGPPSDPLTSTDPQFNYATCTNCGYSIFFDAGALTLSE
jgi:predicted nucleic-acid-binding Zn-ribbon protein